MTVGLMRLAPYRTVLIAGPTASGKSQMALDLAKRCGGVIVNADSMQIYSDLRLITARPSAADEADVPHWLYGQVDGAAVFSTGAWLRSVGKILPDLMAAFPTVIFVGGTGLYFTALTQGLSEIPETPAEVRQNLRDELAELGPQALYARLAGDDPQMAQRLKPSDGQRIIRALEVLQHTGRSLADWQATVSAPLVDMSSETTKAIVLQPGRALANLNIAKRFKAMVEAGGLDEVKTLLERHLNPQLPVMKAIGVKQLGAYFQGEIDLGTAVELAIIASRQYAKRQRTWFAGQMDERWLHVNSAETAALGL